MKMPDFFEFCNKPKIVYKENALSLVGQEAAKLGMKKPIIIADAVMVEKGFAKKIEESLAKAGITPAGIFSDIPPDSDLEIVDKGYALARESSADSLIAIGGGSTMDTAKGIGVMMSMGGRLPQGVNVITEPLPPFIAIPSTAGTGSEMTVGAVIKDKKKKVKLLFQSAHIPSDVAILDPVVTVSMPPKLTASTAMDALCHAVEALHSTGRSPVSDGLALHAVRMIARNVEEATVNGENLEARGAMLVASAVAGLAFSNSLVGCVHAMAHSCGGLYGVPHGVANGILLPYGMEYNLDHATEAYADTARALDIDVSGLSEREAALKAISHIRKLTGKLGLPQSLREAGVPEGGIPAVAELTMLDGTMFTNPRPAEQSEIQEVLMKAFRGDDPACGVEAAVEKKAAQPAAAQPKAKEKKKADEEETPFVTVDQLYKLGKKFSERVFRIPEIEEKIIESKLVCQFVYYDERWGGEEAIITINGSKTPLEIIIGETSIEPTVRMRMHADTANKFWKQKLNLMGAIQQGKIAVEGSVSEAMKLLPVLKPAFAIYDKTTVEMEKKL
ncbi:MAG: iron-containing alcohol dehydrogenase [bacterium]